MYPVIRNPRGSLMRKCDSDKHALAVGKIYHFYVDETAATNGDGTEVNPWNSINNAFNLEIYNRCQQPCTKVYVHISGSIQYGIGYSVDGPIYASQNYNYRLNLIFVPWKQDRVAVNPGLNYLSPYPHQQMAAHCRGVEYRNFDFIQQMHPAEYGIYMVCVYGHCNLIDCTINMYIDGNAVTSTTNSTINAAPLNDANIVINSTINVYADYENSDTHKIRNLTIVSCRINSAIDTTYSYTITGNYRTVSGECLDCYGKIIGVTIEVNIDLDNSINMYGDVRFGLVGIRSNAHPTSIKNSNFSATAKTYDEFDFYGVVCTGGVAVQMHSSNIYVSAISTGVIGGVYSGDCQVRGFSGAGELVDCSITAIASANTVEGRPVLWALGIHRLQYQTNSLLIDSCRISASATVATWPPTGTTDNVRLYQLQCALFSPFNSLNTVYIIDSDLSSGSCKYQYYNAASDTITDDPSRCSSEDYYPASCMLGE